MTQVQDHRKLDRLTQAHVRKRAIKRVLAGESVTAVAKSLGFYEAISKALVTLVFIQQKLAFEIASPDPCLSMAACLPSQG